MHLLKYLAPVVMLSASAMGQVGARVDGDHFPFGVVQPIGAPIPINSSDTYTFSHFVSANHYVVFDLIATNTGGTNFDLTLTNFEFRSTVPTPGSGPIANGEWLRIEVTADFATTLSSYVGSHNITGTTLFQNGQGAFIEKCSIHESTSVACIGAGPSYTNGPYNAGPSSATVPVLGTYSITSEYIFGMYVGTSGYGSVVLPSSGHDWAEPTGGGIPCPTDWDGNGVVNAADFGAFLNSYFLDLAGGTADADFDGNGVVNAADVGAFLNEYLRAIGPCP